MQKQKQNSPQDDQYDIFLSYSHRDHAVVRRAQRTMERWIPVEEDGEKRKLRVFRDESHLTAGDLSERIREALGRSEYLMVFCSQSALESDYVHQELAAFLDLFSLDTPAQQKTALEHVFFGVFEKEPDRSKDLIRRLIAKAMRSKLSMEQLVSLQKIASENVFADYGKSGRSRAMERKETYKVVAAMLGRDLDALLRRGEHRRRRLVASAVGAGVLIGVLMPAFILSYTAMRDRDAKQLSLVAEAQMRSGDRLTAARLALASMESKLFYRTTAPEAVSVLADTSLAYTLPSETHIETSEQFSIRYDKSLSADVSPSGRYLAAVNEKLDVVVWDVQTGQEKWSIRFVLDPLCNPVLRFIGDDMLLVSDFFSARCIDMDTEEELWAQEYEKPESVFRITYAAGGNSSMLYNEEFDGAANFAAGKPDEVLFVERKGGLVLRNVRSGEELARLEADKIAPLLPEGVQYYEQNAIYVLSMLAQSQSPDEIYYDASSDQFYVPCCAKRNVTSRGDSFSIDEVCPGVLVWSPSTGEAKYVPLDNAVYDEDWAEGGMEAIAYPGGELILKRLSGREGDRICAFDCETGSVLWKAELNAVDDYIPFEHTVCGTEQGIAVLQKDSLLFLDAKDGSVKKTVKPELDYNEELLVLLLEGQSAARGTSVESNSLLLLTSRGRICALGADGVTVGAAGQAVSTDKLRYPLYVSGAHAFDGRTYVYSQTDNAVQQYLIGVENEGWRDLTQLLQETARSRHLLSGERLLVKNTSDAWTLYDVSSAAKKLWTVTPEDMERERAKRYEGDSLLERFQDLEFVGEDASEGVIVLSTEELYGFVLLDTETGGIELREVPFGEPGSESAHSADKTRLWSPVLTEDGLFYVTCVQRGEKMEYGWLQYQLADTGYYYHPVGTAEGASSMTELGLVVSPTGKFVVVVGFYEGPVLYSTAETYGKPVNFDLPIEDGDYEYGSMLTNLFFQKGENAAVCAFSADGRRFAVNFASMGQVRVYDLTGAEKGKWSYFNETITDMRFVGKKLLVLTADGRVEEIRVGSGRTLREAQLYESKNGAYHFAGGTDDGLWVLDAYGKNAFCLDTDKLACAQTLRGAWALDLEHGRAYLSDDVLTGSLPLRSAREIIALGRQAAGDTPLSDETRRRFGA